MTLDQVKKLAEEKQIEFFLCSFVEMSGLPKAKVVPATHLADMAEEGAGFAGFATGHMGQGPMTRISWYPRLQLLAVLPWRPMWPGWRATPTWRAALDARALSCAASWKGQTQGYVFNVGWSRVALLRRTEQEHVPADALDILPKPCHDLVTLHRSMDLMTT